MKEAVSTISIVGYCRITAERNYFFDLINHALCHQRDKQLVVV